MTSFYSFECSTQEEMIINKGRLLNDKGESIQYSMWYQNST